MNDRQKVAPPLEQLGLLFREKRRQKGFTQQHTARGAGVSRKQLAALERGENVSVVFIQKVATFLRVTEVPLGEGIIARAGAPAAADVQQLLRIADDLLAAVSVIADRIREVAVDAVLPPAEQASGDAHVIAELVDEVGQLAADDAVHLVRAMENLASGDIARTARPSPQRRASETKRRKREV